MKSSYITNLSLLAVVLMAFWLLQQSMQSPARQTLADIIGSTQVNSITIRRPDSPAISLLRKDQHWHLQQPVPARASNQRAALISSVLDKPIYSEFYPFDDASLHQFGLAEPQLTLQLDEALLLFGSTESISGRRYVMHKGVIYLLDDDLAPLLQATAGSFVEPRLIPETTRLQRLSLPLLDNGRLSQDNRLNVIRQNGQWRSDQRQFSSDQLIQLASAWQQAYAMQVSFIPAELSAAQGTAIRLWLADEDEPVQLWVETSPQGLIINHPAAQLRYLFPAMLAEQLFLTRPAN